MHSRNKILRDTSITLNRNLKINILKLLKYFYSLIEYPFFLKKKVPFKFSCTQERKFNKRDKLI